MRYTAMLFSPLINPVTRFGRIVLDVPLVLRVSDLLGFTEQEPQRSRKELRARASVRHFGRLEQARLSDVALPFQLRRLQAKHFAPEEAAARQRDISPLHHSRASTGTELFQGDFPPDSRPTCEVVDAFVETARLGAICHLWDAAGECQGSCRLKVDQFWTSSMRVA
jgi:hypothetical protein